MEINKANLKWNGELKKRTSTLWLIFHHAQWKNCSIYDIHLDHVNNRGWIGFAYNFFINKAGKIFEGRPIDAADADAIGYNDNSLSCCFEGDFDNERMTEEQVQAGIWLARYCRKLYPGIRVVRHMDVNSTRCPGENFDNRIIFEGMKDDSEMLDNIYKNCVDTVVKALSLNSPNYWLNHQDKYVRRLIELMANYIYSSKGGM
jgi:hypothetical protein